MSRKDGRVVLSAWVDPVLREYAREAARLSGLEFSHWVARAVQQTLAREAVDRAVAAARERESRGGGMTATERPLAIPPRCRNHGRPVWACRGPEALECRRSAAVERVVEHLADMAVADAAGRDTEAARHEAQATRWLELASDDAGLADWAATGQNA